MRNAYMDEAPLASYAGPRVFSWLHVFYSLFYMPGAGSQLIKSEAEETTERVGGHMKMEWDEEVV